MGILWAWQQKRFYKYDNHLLTTYAVDDDAVSVCKSPWSADHDDTSVAQDPQTWCPRERKNGLS